MAVFQIQVNNYVKNLPLYLVSTLVYIHSFLLPTTAYADFQSHIDQFQQQMLTEATLLVDFIEHVQMAYQSTHAQFQPIGAKDPQDPRSLAHKLPSFSTIKNIYVDIIPQQEPGIGHIEITLSFKDTRESSRSNSFFADTQIKFTALGSLGLPLAIPLTNSVPVSVEHAIVGFSCKKIPNAILRSFATYEHDSHTIDLSSMLPYPFNLCAG